MPWTSDRRLYLTADDQVVEDGDERAVSLLVGAEGVVDDETVKKYNLKAKAPADNKAVSKAPANKGK